MEGLGWWVALGLANLTAVLDVERIVIGGGLAEAGDDPARPDPARPSPSWSRGAGHDPRWRSCGAAYGERAGAAGAAMAARDGGLW